MFLLNFTLPALSLLLNLTLPDLTCCPIYLDRVAEPYLARLDHNAKSYLASLDLVAEPAEYREARGSSPDDADATNHLQSQIRTRKVLTICN